jgi:FkbM family methyltransferase
VSPQRIIQSILQRLGLYHRLQASIIYDLYWSWFGRRHIDARNQEVGFYRSLLEGFKEGDVIYDIGANHGGKTDMFLRLGARVVAVEPDDSNQRILQKKFIWMRLKPKPVDIVGKAVSKETGTATMWVHEPGSAKNTISEKWVDVLAGDGSRFGQTLSFQQSKSVPTVTLDELFKRYGMPFFIKIDVEGHEVSVLEGLSKPVPFLSFEVNLPEFVDEGCECVRILARTNPAGQFNYAADCKDGLRLSHWADAAEFLQVLSTCQDPSIEVFWRTQPVPEATSSGAVREASLESRPHR